MKRLFSWLLVLSSFTTYAQFTTVQDGDWNDPATWGAATFPTSTDGTIQVDHAVTIPDGFSLSVDQTTIGATGTLLIDGVLTIVNGTGTDFTISNTDPQAIQISGTGFIILSNSATHSGFTTTNTFFDAGSNYEHQYTTTEGVIPLATWDPTSTLNITGYTTFTTATAGGNWGQTFGFVRWSCAAQTAIVNLGGLLTTIEGNFDIENTNTNILRFGTSQTYTLDITGNLTIGNSPTSTAAVDGVTTGNGTINIGGSFSMNSSGRLFRMSQGANGSCTMNISGDFDLVAGTVNESGGGTSQGNINFVGTDASHFFSSAGTISNTINYTIPATNTVTITGESDMSGTTNSTLIVDGTLRVESTDGNGAIQTGTGSGAGNVRVTTRTYNSGSSIIYAGQNPTPSAQFIGNGHPNTAGVITYIDNSAGVSLNNTSATTVTIGDDLVILNGNLTALLDGLTVNGDVDLQGGDLNLESAGTARTHTLNGNVDLSGGSINVTSGATNANIIFNGDLTGSNFISFTGSNSNLTINGSGALSIDFPIGTATTIEALIVNRTGGSIVFPDDLTVTATTTITTGDVTFNGTATLGTTTAQGITLNGGSATFNGTLAISGDVVLNAGTIDLNASGTVGDDVTLETGTTLFFEGQTLTLNSQFTSNGGVLSSDNTSTLNISNTGTLGTLVFSGAGNSLSTFTLNRPTGGTLVTLNSALTVEDVFTLTDGGFLNTSGLALGSGAILTRNSAASFVGGSVAPTGGPYDVILSGGTMTTGVELGGSLTNVTSTSSGTVTLGSALSLTGLLSVNSGTWTSGANTISTGTFSNAGTFTAPTSTFTVTGDISNSGTFNASTGTTVFNGNTTITGTFTFNNITVSATLNPPATLSLTGNFTNNGTFIPTTGTTVAFSGNTAKSISGSAETTFENISLTGGTAGVDLTITTNQNLAGVLTITNGTAVLDADGAGAAIFTLLSTADSPTVDAGIATIPAGSSITGNVTAQRFMVLEGSLSSNQIWRNIGSPVSNGTVADLQNELPVTGTFTGATGGLTTNPSVFTYDETETGDTDGNLVNNLDDGFESFPLATNTETFAVGRGYSVFIFGAYEPLLSATDARWDLRGPINAGNISFPVNFTSTGDVDNDGWNLVSNPYPSAIDWNSLSSSNMDDAIYFEDYSTGDYVVATYVSGVGTNGGTNILAMGQGFWVKANAASPTLSITEAAKVAGTPTTFFRIGEQTPEILRIALKRGTDRDETVIRLHEEATPGFDSQLDAWKMRNPYWYINVSSSIATSGKDLSINSIKLETCAEQVDLLVTAVTGSYSFEFSDFESIAGDVQLTLVDNYLGTRTNIRQSGSYNFSVNESNAATYDNRFSVELAFESEVVTLNAEPVNTCEVTAAAVTIESSSSDLVYSLFTADGLTEIVANVPGDGTNKNLAIPQSFISLGENQFLVKASNIHCSEVETSKLVSVQYGVNPDAPLAVGDESCNGSAVVLSATNQGTGLTNKWYTQTGIEIPNGGLSQLEVVITSDSTFLVSSVNAIGCESTKTPVLALVIDNAEITVVNPFTLQSNYSTGNQWYLNDEKLEGETEATLQVTISGLYRLEVTTAEGCLVVDELEFAITSLEEEIGSSISSYPNPVKDVLTVTVNSAQPVNGALYSVMGQKVYDLNFAQTGNGWEAHQRVEGSRAVYLLKVVTGSKVSVLRIIKD